MERYRCRGTRLPNHPGWGRRSRPRGTFDAVAALATYRDLTLSRRGSEHPAANRVRGRDRCRHLAYRAQAVGEKIHDIDEVDSDE